MRAIALLATLVLVLGACGRRDMADQRKFKADAAASLFADGKVDQPPPEGTVARDELALEAALKHRPTLTEELVKRGREQFDIYCSPCHGRRGDGNGTVPARGFPHPPDFHTDRLRNAPDQHFLDVIRYGYGAMYSYAARVQPADRWAIVAYIRALQLSQNASASQLPAELRAHLGATGTGKSAP